MKTLKIRLPDVLAHQIEAESRQRKVSKSDVIRERLSRARPRHPRHASLDMIADLIGSVEGLPANLSTEKKKYLKTTGYGQKRHR